MFKLKVFRDGNFVTMQDNCGSNFEFAEKIVSNFRKAYPDTVIKLYLGNKLIKEY